MIRQWTATASFVSYDWCWRGAIVAVTFSPWPGGFRFSPVKKTARGSGGDRRLLLVCDHNRIMGWVGKRK